MSRTFEQHPEAFPTPAVAVMGYDPDADGWKRDALAQLHAEEEAVADYCNPEINLGARCDCVQARGCSERSRVNPKCPACGGSGRPTTATLVAGIDKLAEEIDELAATASDICLPAKMYLDLAWWHAENAIRKITGRCSVNCKRGSFCACCNFYNEMTAKAERAGRTL